MYQKHVDINLYVSTVNTDKYRHGPSWRRRMSICPSVGRCGWNCCNLYIFFASCGSGLFKGSKKMVLSWPMRPPDGTWSPPSLLRELRRRQSSMNIVIKTSTRISRRISLTFFFCVLNCHVDGCQSVNQSMDVSFLGDFLVNSIYKSNYGPVKDFLFHVIFWNAND